MWNFIPLWTVRRRFTDRYEWRGDTISDDPLSYEVAIRDVYNRLAYRLTPEIAVWVKVRALAAGTTAIQGWPYWNDSLMRKVPAELARTVEANNFGRPWSGAAAIDLRPDSVLRQRHDSLYRLSPWLLHLAEGRRGDSIPVSDIVRLFQAQVASAGLRVIHGTAMTRADLPTLAAAGGQLIWSPTSNEFLYGETTAADQAKAAGVPISLGSDWGPSGSKNLLGELIAADAWNVSHERPFTDEELALMVTTNPASASGWEDRLGGLVPSRIADIVVVDRIRRRRRLCSPGYKVVPSANKVAIGLRPTACTVP